MRRLIHIQYCTILYWTPPGRRATLQKRGHTHNISMKARTHANTQGHLHCRTHARIHATTQARTCTHRLLRHSGPQARSVRGLGDEVAVQNAHHVLGHGASGGWRRTPRARMRARMLAKRRHTNCQLASRQATETNSVLYCTVTLAKFLIL